MGAAKDLPAASAVGRMPGRPKPTPRCAGALTLHSEPPLLGLGCPPQEAYSHLDILFQGALQSKKEALESSYMNQEDQ